MYEDIQKEILKPAYVTQNSKRKRKQFKRFVLIVNICKLLLRLIIFVSL